MSIDRPDSSPQTPDSYTAILLRAERARRLLSVHWELTYRCDQRCSHCYLDVLPAGATVKGELTTAECKRIVDEIAELGGLNLTFSGGEILTRLDFFEIAGHARSRRLLLRLFTNATRIGPRTADRIAELHPYSVEVSLYSRQPDVHDRLTGRTGSWRRTVRGIQFLRDRGLRVTIKTPLLGANAGEIDDLERLAGELGAGFRCSTTVTPAGRGSDPLRHRPVYPELVAYYRRRINPAEWIHRRVPSDASLCGIAKTGLTIDPYGNVSPCLEVRRTAGNLRRRSLAEIWSGSPVWTEAGGVTLEMLGICRECTLRDLCLRCGGLAEHEDGNGLGPARMNCLEALARRQALLEQGQLRDDWQVPEHLRGLVSEIEAGSFVAVL